MRTKTTIKPEIKILKTLAVHTELAQYKMPKEVDLSYRTILRTLKPLEKSNYIKLLRTEPSKKGGKDKKIYTLTFKGLWIALSRTHDKQEFEAIISANQSRLLTFKKWTLFKQAKIDGAILDSLRRCVLTTGIAGYLAKRKNYEIDWEDEQTWARSMDAATLVPLVKYGFDGLDKRVFMKLCKQDSELNSFIENHLTQELSEKEAEFRELQQIKETWNKTV